MIAIEVLYLLGIFPETTRDGTVGTNRQELRRLWGRLRYFATEIME